MANTSNKHAYLIMAHHRPDLLKELLGALDYEDNDVFLHIDKKSLAEMPATQFGTERAGLYIVPAMVVNWAGYSQVRCELKMLRQAVSRGHYDYYHLLTGASYPIKSHKEIGDFFKENYGTEFISIEGSALYDRVKYRYLFNESGKDIYSSPLRKMMRGIYLRWQNFTKQDRFKGYGLTYKKGLAYWSITHDLAQYVLSQEETIEKIFAHSLSADEAFLQTVAYNRKFRDRISQQGDPVGNSLRLTTWEIEEKRESMRPGHNFVMGDLEIIENSPALFALKFEGKDGIALIRHIKSDKKFL